MRKPMLCIIGVLPWSLQLHLFSVMMFDIYGRMWPQGVVDLDVIDREVSNPI
jgi:hypothetical protein